MPGFEKTLSDHGADLASIRWFDDESAGPELLPYATLLSARQAGDPYLGMLDGVYEWQNSPLVFLVDGDRLGDDPESLKRVRRLVAMRGDAPYLGIVKPGRLAIHQVALDGMDPSSSRIDLPVGLGEVSSTFIHLGNQRPGLGSAPKRDISKVVLHLLEGAIDTLKLDCGISGPDAISLVGRALFARFLGDRHLLPPGWNAAEIFDEARQAASTSAWLDRTFNGDFLPLSDGMFDRLSPRAFKVLGDVMRKADGGQLSLGWQEKWDYLDFAHIPVGVLSQAYESYLRTHESGKQHKEGGYYTPRPIAELMVRGAFLALRADGKAHEARVLDPAAGAGVFLLTVFRQLVAERWRYDGVRPDTKTLRDILYGQLAGFDINEAALRFAALGLYLVSIDLDPHPEPVQKLKFENLRGRVLYKFGEDQGNRPSQSLGSLGEEVGEDHVHRYDLVIGNPPWSSGTRLPGFQTTKKIVARIAGYRLPEGSNPPPLPNEVLDLPFVWRAMEWAKPGSQIAFALHARVLFQQGDGMPQARAALFGALEVTGIVNGAELRHTQVWPEVSAPFCLLFARNRVPAPGAGFRFVSPHWEKGLNAAGGLRIDVRNSAIVASEQVVQIPDILKILFRGGPLDLEIRNRMRRKNLVSLYQYWAERFGLSKGELRQTGNGYQKLRPSSRTKKAGDGLPGDPAGELDKLPELTKEAMLSIVVDRSRLETFELKRVHHARSLAIYSAPLLVVHKSPPSDRQRVAVSIASGDLRYNQSFYGYSAKGHPEGQDITRYLALVLGSRPAFWHILIASGEFGFERDTVEKTIIETTPLVPFEDLGASDRSKAQELFAALVEDNGEANWRRVDEWVASLYGLGKRDLQVIEDTLAYNLPFARNRNAAEKPPSREQLMAFQESLAGELAPWGDRSGHQFLVEFEPGSNLLPWRIFRIQARKGTTARLPLPEMKEFLADADAAAASEFVFADQDERCLWIGRLNQARYWCRSQTFLVARKIIWEHADFLLGQEDE